MSPGPYQGLPPYKLMLLHSSRLWLVILTLSSHLFAVFSFFFFHLHPSVEVQHWSTMSLEEWLHGFCVHFGSLLSSCSLQLLVLVGRLVARQLIVIVMIVQCIVNVIKITPDIVQLRTHTHTHTHTHTLKLVMCWCWPCHSLVYVV